MFRETSINKRWPLVILVVIAGVSVLHYTTRVMQHTDHVLYVKLYYVPVTVAALLYGVHGGLLTAILVAMIYGPCLVLRSHRLEALSLDFALDLLILFGIGTLIGVTVDRERHQHRRAQQAERLAALGHAAAMMAHEIKVPLVTIGGFARILLRQRTIADGDRQKLEVIAVEVARLERLAHNALDLACPKPLEWWCCSLQELLDRTRHVIQPQAKRKGICVVEACDATDVKLKCDPEKIQQVLINLLDNAVQHTPAGGTVQLRMGLTSAGMLRFEIRDAGPGIPDEMLETLFEPFSSRRKGGNGLGLAIAQQIVQAYGSRISATNLPEGGATFQFELPVEEDKEMRKTSHEGCVMSS